MASRTDAELIEIGSCQGDDWQPEAVEAAKSEIAKRGLVYEPSAGAPSPPAPRSEGEPLEPVIKIPALALGLLFTVLGLLIAMSN